MKKFIQEFKSFTLKGNVMDLAIGVIIGAAFGKIISALVDNILMPAIGALAGGKSFDDYSATIGSATIKYGTFLTAVLDFLIVALCLFILIKVMNRALRKKAQEPAPLEKPADIKLLEEIRDLLKNRQL